jgi:uncharacterized protein (TIGR02217 family)
VAHHEVRFPETISRDSASGPSTFTNIVELDSGGEQRVARWSAARWRGDAVKGLRGIEDCVTVLAFYRARLGPAHSFRYKDWLDMATTPSGRTWGTTEVVTKDDVLLGTGDASKTQFQLIKKYVSGPTTIVRNLTKPVNGTVKIALDGTLKTEGVDYTIDYATGIVTFGAAPGVGVLVTAGCEFDVPVRFGADVDLSGLMARITGHTQATISSIPLVEVIDGLEVPEDAPMRGGSDFVMSANISITMQDGAVITVDPQSGGLKIIVPDETTGVGNLALGGPYWWITNKSGANSVAVHEGAAGGTLVTTIAASGAKVIVLGQDSGGAKKWYAL